MKILIVKLSSIGDVVHTLPSLAALRRGLSGCPDSLRIDWLVEEAASGILEGHPMIDNLIVVEKRALVRSPFKALKVAGSLRKARYDAVLDFQGLFKSGLWVALSRGRRRIGFANARELSHIFYNEKLPPYDKELHAVERYLKLAAVLGGDSGEASFELHTDKGAENAVSTLLKEGGIKLNRPLVTVVPSARWKTKLWDEEKFSILVKRMVGELRVDVVIAGGTGDAAVAERISKASGGVALSLAGRTGLKELAVLLKLSDFAVTVDSGPMHIAAAAGTPVVALFGPTAPWRTGPYGPAHRVVRHEMDCSPCFSRECRETKCMDDIGANEVFAAVSEMAGSVGACHAKVRSSGE